MVADARSTRHLHTDWDGRMSEGGPAADNGKYRRIFIVTVWEG